MRTLEELEAKLAEPSKALVEDMKSIDGDIMLLGVGGKMGPSLAKLAMNAIKEAGVSKRVIGVSRFSEAGLREQLEAEGVETIACDLLDDEQLQKLPEVENVIYMAGTKFGTYGKEYFTWAMNSYLPGRVAEKYKNARIVAFSTGNVYPFMPLAYGGAVETTPPAPIGEYGSSCLGRERVFEYFSRKYDTPLAIYRLNYAIDLRYGVLLEIAKSVRAQKPISLAMGHVNCIWQGDANEIAIRALKVCSNPVNVLNVTGPETISVRWLAQEFGRRFGVEPVFEGEESPNALLNNASKANQLFGYPKVSLLQMIDWMTEWLEADGATINKPTHFQERAGKY
ncbi:NAD(P)-dependent oxidoreductase [Paenibacillus sp. HB172176]|uniref:NAD-dependent epimerase/dehydratase family protein n=1 Tax=Paenibacillus sp. HB172176 TaxID=2493690 RepID=UPI00143B6C3D|nr:NAD(P)-dependent oxidoreductase [Paenibacillus sp. HB172176]